jgi:hypothetical protein
VWRRMWRRGRVLRDGSSGLEGCGGRVGRRW